MLAYSTDDKVFIKNIVTDKQAKIDHDDVRTIHWDDDNENIFLGDEHGKVA